MTRADAINKAFSSINGIMEDKCLKENDLVSAVVNERVIYSITYKLCGRTEPLSEKEIKAFDNDDSGKANCTLLIEIVKDILGYYILTPLEGYVYNGINTYRKGTLFYKDDVEIVKNAINDTMGKFMQEYDSCVVKKESSGTAIVPKQNT